MQMLANSREMPLQGTYARWDVEQLRTRILVETVCFWSGPLYRISDAMGASQGYIRDTQEQSLLHMNMA